MTMIHKSLYKGFPCAQHADTFDVFRRLFHEVEFDLAVELGTWAGAFSLFLRDSLPLTATFVTLDKQDRRDPQLRTSDFDFRRRDVFQEDTVAEVRALIGSSHCSLVLCDDGKKIEEFRLYAPLLRRGDVIMAHDYAPSREFFHKRLRGQRWDFCEITSLDISETIVACGLEPLLEHLFIPVAWGSYRKITP